jgi:hypothetical protein
MKIFGHDRKGIGGLSSGKNVTMQKLLKQKRCAGLEFVYFEQAEVTGSDKAGLFVTFNLRNTIVLSLVMMGRCRGRQKQD